VARFLVGFGGTGFYIAIPMYIAEISSNECVKWSKKFISFNTLLILMQHSWNTRFHDESGQKFWNCSGLHNQQLS
jgi:hypothetical protein